MIKGTGVALITPFHNYGTIDFTSLGKLTKHVIEGGVDFLVALGTTSEVPVLSADEKNAVLNQILEITDGKVPVIIGVGGNNTQGIVDSLKSIDFEGISGILSVAPYYNNVPGRTSSNINAETTLRLANEYSNIAGIKEASGDLGQIMQIIKNRPKGFSVLSGDDALTYPMLALGADGVISVVANAFPRQFSQMVNLALKGNYEEARSMHYELMELIEALFEDGNPAGIKAALDAIGIVGNNLRLPLVKANKATYNKITTLVNKIK